MQQVLPLMDVIAPQIINPLWERAADQIGNTLGQQNYIYQLKRQIKEDVQSAYNDMKKDYCNDNSNQQCSVTKYITDILEFKDQSNNQQDQNISKTQKIYTDDHPISVEERFNDFTLRSPQYSNNNVQPVLNEVQSQNTKQEQEKNEDFSNYLRSLIQ